MSPTSRPAYDVDQIHKYLEHVQYPYDGPQSDLPQPTLENLRTLIIHQLSTTPFENLSLHYTRHSSPHIFTEPQEIFTKIVLGKKRRGGYCMELNTLFACVLRGLGYRVRSVGARVSGGASPDEGSEDLAKFGGWTHIVNLVTIADETDPSKKRRKYLVDVSFGIDVPTSPLLLIPDVESDGLPGWKVRLQHKPFGADDHDDDDDDDDETQKLWWVQQRPADDPSAKWTTGYVFTELEFSPADIRVMNFYTSHHRSCFFTYCVLAMGFLWDEVDADDKKKKTTRRLTGVKWVMADSYSERRGSKKEKRKLQSEEERVKCLRENMGFVITDDEAKSIDGTAACIRG